MLSYMRLTGRLSCGDIGWWYGRMFVAVSLTSSCHDEGWCCCRWYWLMCTAMVVGGRRWWRCSGWGWWSCAVLSPHGVWCMVMRLCTRLIVVKLIWCFCQLVGLKEFLFLKNFFHSTKVVASWLSSVTSWVIRKVDGSHSDKRSFFHYCWRCCY